MDDCAGFGFAFGWQMLCLCGSVADNVLDKAVKDTYLYLTSRLYAMTPIRERGHDYQPTTTTYHSVEDICKVDMDK